MPRPAAARGRLLLTLGHRDDEAPYPVRLETFAVERPDAASIEAALTRAAASDPVLCHDLYVAGDRQVVLVVMRLAEARPATPGAGS